MRQEAQGARRTREQSAAAAAEQKQKSREQLRAESSLRAESGREQQSKLLMSREPESPCLSLAWFFFFWSYGERSCHAQILCGPALGRDLVCLVRGAPPAFQISGRGEHFFCVSMAVMMTPINPSPVVLASGVPAT
jgi:hypothetical protein